MHAVPMTPSATLNDRRMDATHVLASVAACTCSARTAQVMQRPNRGDLGLLGMQSCSGCSRAPRVTILSRSLPCSLSSQTVPLTPARVPPACLLLRRAYVGQDVELDQRVAGGGGAGEVEVEDRQVAARAVGREDARGRGRAGQGGALAEVGARRAGRRRRRHARAHCRRAGRRHRAKLGDRGCTFGRVYTPGQREDAELPG